LGVSSVWGNSASDVFAVGGSHILHYDGSSWSALNNGPMDRGLGSVWGSSSSDVFAVGDGGTIIHYPEPSLPSLPVTTNGGLPFWIWIVVGVAAVMIVGVLAYFLWRSRARQ
jgi:hypothetical protein